MAEHLTSLNRHFDMCVQAVRATEGGAALARRKAAEGDDAASENGVSISGVIGSVSASASASAHTDAPHRHLDVLPSAAARAEIAQVVVQDAPEVAEVVAELEAVLARMEADFGTLRAQAGRIRAAFAATLAAFHALEDVGARLAGYAAAEAEFAARWAAEKDLVGDRLGEMDELRRFYEGYAGAYDSLRLEAERRRAVEAKIAATWRKARDAVDRLVERDRRERDAFRHEVGEYLPTDLWSGMQAPPRRWAVVPVEPPGEGPGSGASSHAGNTAGLKAARPGAEEERAAPKRRVARASGSMSGSFAGR